MSGECYLGTIDPENGLHRIIIVDIFPKAQHRLFIDAFDIPQKPASSTWPDFVNHVWTYMPDGMRFWKNDENQDHHLLGVMGEGSILNQLKMCKATGAIPIICIGHSEEKRFEPSAWLHPQDDNLLQHLDFLEEFSRQTAIWLRNKMGFIQAHLEVWNEAAKFMSAETYAKVVMAMAKGFMQYKNFKVHFGSNDIEIDLNDYLPKLKQNAPLMTLMKGQYYSTHELWPRQHGQGYIGKMVELLAGTGIELSITECSPNGDWGKYGIDNDWGPLFNDIIKYGIKIYCILFIIRRDFFGDVFDEIRVFTREGRPDLEIAPGGWLPNGYNAKKHEALRRFNQTYFKNQIPIESEGPVADRVIKLTSPAMEGPDVKVIEDKLRALGFDINVNSRYESDDYSATRKFQELSKIVIDGVIGPQTKDKLKNTTVANFYPEVWQNIYISKGITIKGVDYWLENFAIPSLADHGKYFVQAEAETGIPVEWQLAIGMQESGERNSAGKFLLGQSYYGRELKNLYGWAITDSGPLSQGRFETYRECILKVPTAIKKLFLDPANWRYNGDHIFGIEVKYSTAPYNAINKAKYYREIVEFLSTGFKTRMPDWIEDLFPFLDKRYQLK